MRFQVKWSRFTVRKRDWKKFFKALWEKCGAVFRPKARQKRWPGSCSDKRNQL